MPGDDDDNTLQLLLTIQSLVSGVGMVLPTGKNVLETLIEQARAQGAETEFPKTGRRAAIAAQKARKNA